MQYSPYQRWPLPVFERAQAVPSSYAGASQGLLFPARLPVLPAEPPTPPKAMGSLFPCCRTCCLWLKRNHARQRYKPVGPSSRNLSSWPHERRQSSFPPRVPRQVWCLRGLAGHLEQVWPVVATITAVTSCGPDRELAGPRACQPGTLGQGVVLCEQSGNFQPPGRSPLSTARPGAQTPSSCLLGGPEGGPVWHSHPPRAPHRHSDGASRNVGFGAINPGVVLSSSFMLIL